MYKCDADRNCQVISGYFLSAENEYYPINKNGVVEIGGSIQSIQDGTSDDCTKDKIGYAYTSTYSYICIDEGLDVKIATGYKNHHFILGNGNSVEPFIGVSNKAITFVPNDGNTKIPFVVVDEDIKAENNNNYVMHVKVAGDTAEKDFVYKYSKLSNTFERDVTLSGAKNYKLLATGSNIYEEYPLTDTKSILTAPTDWMLYNCRAGECLQTYGYMKSHNEKKFFKYDASDSGAITMLTTSEHFTDCKSTGTVNNINDEGSLCIVLGLNASTVGTLGEMIDGNYYVIGAATANVFVVSENAGGSNSAIISATQYSLTTDNLYEEFGATLTLNSKKISSKEIPEVVDDLANVKLYSCLESSVCTLTNGYAKKDEDVLYKFANGVTSAIYYPPHSVDCSTNVGEIITDVKKNYICLNDGQIKADISMNGYYPFGSTTISSGTFTGKEGKMLKVSDELIAINEDSYPDNGNYVVQIGDIYKEYAQSGKAFTAGASTIVIYKPIPNTNLFKKVASATISAVTKTTDISDWVLFDCDGAGECERTYGYYMAGASTYLSIPANGVNEVLTENDDIKNNTCENASDIGKLIKDGSDIKLCVVNHATKASQVAYDLTTANGKNYYLPIDNANVFASSVSEKSVIVKGTTTSFTLLKVDPIIIHNINASTKQVTDVETENYTTSEATRAIISILKCSSNICEKIDGYTVSSGTYYKISKSSGASALTPTEATCTSANVGKIIKISNVETLCLSTSNSIAVTAAGKYAMGTVSSTDSPLVSGKMVEVTANYIVVDDSLDDGVNANYLIKIGDDYLTYSYSSGTFSQVSNISGMRVFEKVSDGSNVLKEVTDLMDLNVADITNLMYVSCGSGKCVPKNAYLLIGGKAVAKCEDNGTCAISTNITDGNECKIETAGYNHVGKVAVSSTSTLQLCMANGENQALFDVYKNYVYFTGDPSSDITKYIVNDKKDIIYLPKPEMGYYLVKDNKLDSSGDKVVMCDGVSDTCSILAADTCDAPGKIGKITNDKKVCLNGSITSGTLGTNGVSYLISSGAESAFTALVRNGKFGVVTMISDTLYLDKSKAYVCVKDSDLTVTVRENASATCANGSTKYACNTLGVCIAGDIKPPEKDLMICPSTSGTGLTSNSYCIDSDNKIYATDGSKYGTDAQIDTGVHVFRIGDPEDDVQEVDLTSETAGVLSTDLGKIVMYQCDASKVCTPVSGYIKMNVFTLITSSSGYEATRDYVKTDDVTFAVTVAQAWGDEDFFSKSTGYYSVSIGGGATAVTPATLAAVTGDTHCSGNVGKIGTNSANTYLCLDAGISIDLGTATGNFVLGTPASGTVFEGKGGKMVIVDATFTSIVIDDSISALNNEEYVIKVDNTHHYAYKFTTEGGYGKETTAILDIYKGVENHSNVYIKASATDLSGISAFGDLNSGSYKIFGCTSGSCEIKKGYILAGSDNGNAYAYTTQWAAHDDGDCGPSADGNIGNVKKNGTPKKLELCMDGESNAFAVLTSGKQYLLAKGGAKTAAGYKIYSGNGSTIIVEDDSTPVTYCVVANEIVKASPCSGDGKTEVTVPVACYINSGVGRGCDRNTYYSSSTDCASGSCAIQTNPASAANLFFCKDDGSECEKVATTRGIYINSPTEYFEYNGSNFVKKTGPIAAKGTCSSPGTLMVSGDDYYLCLIESGEPVKLTSTSTDYAQLYYEGNPYNIQSTGYGIVTLKDKSITLKATGATGYFLIKDGHILKDYDSTAGAYTGAVYISCDAGVCTTPDVPGTAGYYKNAANTGIVNLIYNDGSSVSLVLPTLGYYKVNTNAYVKCTGTDTVTCIDNVAATCSNAASNGGLTSAGALCLDTTASGAWQTDTDVKYYLVKAGDNNIFGGVSVVKATSTEMHIDSEKTAICVNSSSEVTDNGGSCTGGSTAYTCVAGTSCTEDSP